MPSYVPGPWQLEHYYSTAVVIFIFQLSQEEWDSNIYTLAFNSERTEIMRDRFS